MEEAKRRGLPNIGCMVDAVEALTSEQTIELFEKFGVFTKAELESRKEIKYEAYSKAINIEAKTMIDVASKQIIPAVIKYTRQLADSINAVVAAGVLEVEVQTELLRETSALLKKTKDALNELKKVTEEALTERRRKRKCNVLSWKSNAVNGSTRTPVDELEMIVDQRYVADAILWCLLFDV